MRPSGIWRRGQAENLIKAHKLHLASDRTSCTKATANQFRLLIHTAAFWLMLSLRGLAPQTSFWRDAQFDTIRLCLIKVAGRVTEMVTRIKIALPTAYPYQIGFAALARPTPRQAAALNDGAVCPATNPSAQPQTQITASPTPRKNAPWRRPQTEIPGALTNDPGWTYGRYFAAC